MIGKMAAAMALMLLPVAAMAQDAETSEVDGWSIAPVMPRVCQAAGAFHGTTVLSFIDSDQNPGMIALVDSEWTLVEGTTHDAQVSWDGWKTSRSIPLTAGKSSNGLWTMTSLVDRDFSERTHAAKGIAIRLPALKLDGSVRFPDTVLAALTACIHKD